METPPWRPRLQPAPRFHLDLSLPHLQILEIMLQSTRCAIWLHDIYITHAKQDPTTLLKTTPDDRSCREVILNIRPWQLGHGDIFKHQ